MFWFVIILAVVVGGLVGFITRNLKKGFQIGLTVFIVGIVLSLLIVYSGLMGG